MVVYVCSMLVSGCDNCNPTLRFWETLQHNTTAMETDAALLFKRCAKCIKLWTAQYSHDIHVKNLDLQDLVLQMTLGYMTNELV